MPLTIKSMIKQRDRAIRKSKLTPTFRKVKPITARVMRNIYRPWYIGESISRGLTPSIWRDDV